MGRRKSKKPDILRRDGGFQSVDHLAGWIKLNAKSQSAKAQADIIDVAKAKLRYSIRGAKLRNLMTGALRKIVRHRHGDHLSDKEADSRFQNLIGTTDPLDVWRSIGRRVMLTAEERVELELWLIDPYDQTREQVLADLYLRQEARKPAIAAKRREKRNLQPRHEYLARAEMTRAEIKSSGKSRSQFYRDRAKKSR